MELHSIEDGIWYDSYSKIVYYMNKNGDLIDMGEYYMYSDSENPFSNAYFFDNQHGNAGVCYFEIDYVNDMCYAVDLTGTDNPRREFEMKYISDWYSIFEEEEPFELNDENWVYEFDNDTQLPIFFKLEDAGKTEIEPQFDKEKDVMYYTLLQKLSNNEYLDSYIERVK